MTEVSGGFLMKKNKFLFCKRSKKKTWAPGVWDIAGGHLEPGEPPLQALKREVEEELGVIVLHARLLTTMIIADVNKKENFKYHIYMITSWKGKPYNASHEHSKIRWFTRAQLAMRQLALPGYLQLIDGWMNA